MALDLDLTQWYLGEQAGFEFFEALANAVTDEAASQKWLLLGGLESAMAERLRLFCNAESIPLPEPSDSKTHLDYAKKMAAESWLGCLDELEPQLQDAVKSIRSAQGAVPAEHAAIAADYLAHEEALLAFVTAERAGEDGFSAIESLLQDWSPNPVSGPSN